MQFFGLQDSRHSESASRFDLDPLGVFPLFLKIITDIIAPKLSISFRG